MRAYRGDKLVYEGHLGAGVIGYVCDRIEIDAKDAAWLCNLVCVDPPRATRHCLQFAGRFAENRSGLYERIKAPLDPYAAVADGIFREPSSVSDCCGGGTYNGHAPWCKVYGARAISEGYRREALMRAPYRDRLVAERAAECAREQANASTGTMFGAMLAESPRAVIAAVCTAVIVAALYAFWPGS